MEVKDNETPLVDVTITSDGLRVALYDRQDTPLFKSNQTELTPWADFVVQNLSWLVARYPFEVVVESYTSEQPTSDDAQWHSGDSGWELSTQRGNIFRRRLQYYANEKLNFRSVVGYGPSSSFSERELASGKTNQRIALSLSLSEPHQLPDFSMVGENLQEAKSVTPQAAEQESGE
jgi:flagellar motor protein MotB